MFTINDLSKELVNNSDIFFINIIIDFLNNFIRSFNVLSKEEILYRINRLEYIGLSNNYYRCDDANATFGSGIYYYVALNKKNSNLDINLIKTYLYHELIHCLSCHYEGKRLVNGLCLSVNNGSLFDEIMTEYYSQILLLNENIINENKIVLKEKNDYEEFFTCSASGYYDYMPLGRIYDYFFQNDLVDAKFNNHKLFIHKFNELIEKLNINDFDYESFINEVSFNKRFHDITLLFIKYLIYCYEINNLNKNEIINSKEISTYIELLSKERIKNITIPNRKMYFYIYNELYKFIYKDNKIIKI